MRKGNDQKKRRGKTTKTRKKEQKIGKVEGKEMRGAEEKSQFSICRHGIPNDLGLTTRSAFSMC
jgi:hypothetical protein